MMWKESTPILYNMCKGYLENNVVDVAKNNFSIVKSDQVGESGIKLFVWPDELFVGLFFCLFVSD